jgi:hypothetical protein
MSSGSVFAERCKQSVAKTRRRSGATPRSQTRKRERMAIPPPSTKKTVPFSKDYIPRDQETEIPISSYQPLTLPLATAGALSKASTPNRENSDIIYYKLSQSETKDTFIVKVKTSGIHGIEILVGGSIRSVPKECVKIYINTTEISDTQTIRESQLFVDYNERCNIAKNLKSALILARVAISFVFTYYKIDKFILRDQSAFHCKTSTEDYEFSCKTSTEDYEFFIAGRELLKYGQTWYQRHLNAHIYHPRTVYNIQRYLSFVNTKPPWSAFSHYSIAERLKPYWDKSANYKELVLTLLDDIQRIYPNSKMDEHTNDNCHILHPWFNNITSQYLQNFPVVDNFILRDGFPFVKGLKVEFIPENENAASPHSLQMGGRAGWNEPGLWFTERNYR